MQNFKCLYERFYLPRLKQTVKVFFLTGFLFYGHQLTAHCSTKLHQVILAKGEHREVDLKGTRRYSVGNREILSLKKGPKGDKLLIKGKMVGFTELILWKKGRKKEIFQIYCMRKDRQLEMTQLASSLQALGLRPTFQGKLIIVSGPIDDRHIYKTLYQIWSQFPRQLVLKTIPSPNVTREIIGDIYFSFYQQYIDSIFCLTDNFFINCYYDHTTLPDKKSIDHFRKIYPVRFLKSSDGPFCKNYKLKMKIIQIEKINGEEINLGLDQINTSLDQLFQGGVRALVSNNRLLFTKKKLVLSTLAEPETTVCAGHSSTIQVGSEIPFTAITGNSSNQHTVTKWKFAGLKIKFTLIKKGEQFILKYDAGITHPGGQQEISGNRERSQAAIEIQKPLQLFQIGMRSFGRQNKSIPFLESIPLLKHLFLSKSYQENYKKIIAVATLEKL